MTSLISAKAQPKYTRIIYIRETPKGETRKSQKLEKRKQSRQPSIIKGIEE
jgi:hypothetical protein